jgi:iron complex outermembrane recepter protein
MAVCRKGLRAGGNKLRGRNNRKASVGVLRVHAQRRILFDKLFRAAGMGRVFGCVGIAAAALISTVPHVALAQDQSSEGVSLQEIVVTAQRRSENAQSVPITMTAVSAEQLQSSGVVTPYELPNLVPGLAIGSVQGAFQPYLRGIGTPFFGPGIENPVALYIDDIYYSSQLMAPSDLSDISQIAVLKGPQGTLFGRNSTGGVIQMTTMQPLAEFGGFVRTELDNYLTTRSVVYVTGEVADNLAANVTLKYATQGNGWGRNLSNGDDIDKINMDFSVRNKWLWTPTEGTVVKLNLDFTHRTDSFGPNYSLLNPPGFTGFFPGYGATVFSSNPYDVTNVVTDKNHLEQGGAGLTIEQDLGVARLVSITGYRHYDFENLTDSTGSTEFESLVYQHPTGDQFSQEFQLQSKEGGPFNWVVGAYYFNGVDNLPQDLIYYNYYSTAYFGFDGATSSSVVDSNYLIHMSTNSLAFFAQGTLQLGAADHVTAGLRHTEERRSIYGPTNTYIDGVFDPDPFVTYLYDGQYKDSRWTWRFSEDHEFTKDVMGYASYNRGFKSGGFNAFFLAPPYSPEVVDAYEVGLKTELLDHTLRLNAAAFYNKYTNMQQLIITNFFLEVKNASAAKIKGLDLDAEWKASDALTFTGGLEWLQARFTDFPALPYAAPMPGGGILTYSPGVLPELNGTGLSLPFAPDLSADIAVNYTVPLSVGKIVLNLTDSFNSGFYFQPDNIAHQGSFDLVNTSVTWTSADDRLSIGLFGRNLGNKAVPTFDEETPPTGFLADYGNPPRTYGFNVQYRFGH